MDKNPLPSWLYVLVGVLLFMVFPTLAIAMIWVDEQPYFMWICRAIFSIGIVVFTIAMFHKFAGGEDDAG